MAKGGGGARSSSGNTATRGSRILNNIGDSAAARGSRVSANSRNDARNAQNRGVRILNNIGNSAAARGSRDRATGRA
jgi:hypothetical protein